MKKRKSHICFCGRLSRRKAQRKPQIALSPGIPDYGGHDRRKYKHYFDETVYPLQMESGLTTLDLPQKELETLYQKAKALLCPTRWAEPFGMVNVEAQACGTPVLGARRGALPEIIQEGKTGFLFDTIEEAVQLMERLDKIQPSDCRANAEERFSAEVMARGYSLAYEKALASV